MNLANALLFLGLATLPMAARALDDGPDAAALVKQLGDQDYQTRKEAYRALEKMGADARGELQKAAKSDDPEVRWSASLLLDRLAGEQDEPAERVERGHRGVLEDGRSTDPLDDPVQEMHDSIRRLFGERFFDDPLRAWHSQGGLGGQLDLGPGSSFSRSIDDGHIGGQRESLSIRVDQDGRVTVEQEKDGEKMKFEADSIETLRKEHPELLQGLGGLGGLGGMTLRIGPLGTPLRTQVAPRLVEPKLGAPKLGAPRLKSGLERPQPKADTRADGRQADRPDAASPDDEPAPTNKPRLGVQVAPVKADVADYLELDAGVGLEVVRVVAGSAAEKLGVKARDILTEVNGKTIRDVADVAKALGDQDPATAEVIVIRRGAEKTLAPRKKK